MFDSNGKFAFTIKIGDKGQIVIPKEVRDLFELKAGDSVLLLADIKRGIAIPTKQKAEKILGHVFAISEDDNE